MCSSDLNALLKEKKQFISQFLKPPLLKKHSYKQNNKLSIPIIKTLKQVKNNNVLKLKLLLLLLLLLLFRLFSSSPKRADK